jgi:hypothetical protein
MLGADNLRLDGRLTHRGNEYPSAQQNEAALHTAAEIMGRWLATAGYRGPLGLDFLVTGKPGEPPEQVLLAEINGRINGATYVIAVTERLNQRRASGDRVPLACWRSSTGIATLPRCFAGFADALDDLLYAEDRAAGIVPYNVGMLSHGSVNLLFVGACEQELDALEAEARARLER